MNINNFFEYVLNFYIINFHNPKLLKKINLKEFHTILDIGAHNAELFNTILKKNIIVDSYIAFEPIEELFNELIKKYKNFHNFTAINVALSDKSGNKEIIKNSFSSTNTFSKINNKKFKYKVKKFLQFLLNNNSENIEKVKVTTLDSLINSSYTKIDILKIDTEGHELQVILGGENFLKQAQPKFLILELQSKDNYIEYNPIMIEKKVRELGYIEIFSLRGPFNLFQDHVYKLKK